MRTKLIAAIVAGGCVLGFQAAAVAQDSNEHPSVATPSQAQQNPNAAAQDRDRSTMPSSSSDTTGRPAPGPHDSR